VVSEKVSSNLTYFRVLLTVDYKSLCSRVCVCVLCDVCLQCVPSECICTPERSLLSLYAQRLYVVAPTMRCC
jgi:hypothetical protein